MLDKTDLEVMLKLVDELQVIGYGLEQLNDLVGTLIQIQRERLELETHNAER